jgi:GT2 family glycosyltransferase
MIGLVLATYAHWPERLIDSVEAAGIPTTWYIHHHGNDPAFARRLGGLAARRNFSIHMHMRNRGLSRSWNEGIHQAYAEGCELVLLVNDDLHFVNEGFKEFLHFAWENTGYGLAFLHGLETGGSPLAGRVIEQGFGCCVFTKLALERVGYLDENFWPAYYEDVDYGRRCRLSNVNIISSPKVLIEHERSKTTRDNPDILEKSAEVMRLNEDYYTRKWGPPYKETFVLPFDSPKFTNRISWSERANPYPGFRRAESER